MFNYLALGSLVLAIAIFIGTITPVYNRLKEAENKSIQHATQTTAMAINEWMRRVQDLAWQITSRTRVRQELEKYNDGKVTLQQLKSFTEPKLTDALNFSESVVGITRLDNQNRIVATCGQNIPIKKWESIKQNGKNIAVSVPYKIGDRCFVVISAPILNRENDSVGIDLVLINMYDLSTIISKRTKAGGTMKAMMGYFVDNDFSPILTSNTTPTMRIEENQNHYKQMLEVENKNEIYLSKFGGSVAGFSRLESFDWWLVLSQEENILYSKLHNRLLVVCLLVVGLYIIFLFGFRLIAKPLAGKILLHTSELEATILEKTSELKHEIEVRKQTEKAHEETIGQLSDALSDVRTLKGLLPICSHCKKIRDDKGYWNTLESYISEHSEAEFSHGICQECAKKYYPDFEIYKE